MSFRMVHISMFVSVTFLAADAARGQHFDIFLARPAAGSRTVTGGADVDALFYNDVTRVFESELGVLGGEFISLEPGVNHPNIGNPGLTGYPASAAQLQPGDTLRLRERNFNVGGFVDDLFFWNGIGSVSFAPAAADFRIDGGDPLGSTAGAGGAFDDHPFLVVDDNSLPGIYLASVHGIVNDFAPSAPIYLVLGTEALITSAFLGITQEEFDMLSEEELEEALDAVIDPAVDWVNENLSVPEPGSLALFAVGSTALFGASRARRRPICVLAR